MSVFHERKEGNSFQILKLGNLHRIIVCQIIEIIFLSTATTAVREGSVFIVEVVLYVGLTLTKAAL
jgi:hypothetical protein